VVTLRDVRSESLPPKFESQEVAAEIGRLVKHSRRVVFVARYYGIPLQHNAMIAGAYWPRPITYWLYRTPGERKLSIGERLAALDFDPEYFVITFLTEYENHHADLARYLEGHCVVKARTTEYLIFERCSPPEG
jgi:hypothetical protein